MRIYVRKSDMSEGKNSIILVLSFFANFAAVLFAVWIHICKIEFF